MGPIGMQEMIFIFVLALLLFGPKKLPELGKMLAKGLTEFRRAKNELKSTFETHLHELEKEARIDMHPPASTPTYSSSSPRSSYSYDEYGHNDYTYGSSTAAIEPGSSPQSDQSEQASPPSVAGTVPRANGVHPIESLSTPAKEEHTA